MRWPGSTGRWKRWTSSRSPPRSASRPSIAGSGRTTPAHRSGPRSSLNSAREWSGDTHDRRRARSGLGDAGARGRRPFSHGRGGAAGGWARRQGVVLLSVPTQDRCAVSQRMLDEGVAWVLAQLDAGQRVLVHCEYGIGRSALLALCVLTARGTDPLQALRMLKAARSKVSPSPEQLGAFRTFIERQGGMAPPLQAPFEGAYAHLAGGELATGRRA